MAEFLETFGYWIAFVIIIPLVGTWLSLRRPKKRTHRFSKKV